MAGEAVTSAEARGDSRKRLRDSTAVIPEINDPGRHTRPMAAFPEPENNTIRSFTRDGVDLARRHRASLLTLP